LAKAQNKLYFFEDFPKVARPTTLLSKSLDEIRAFIGQPETQCHPETTAAARGRHAVAFLSAEKGAYSSRSADTQTPWLSSEDLIIDAYHEIKMRTAYLEGLECEAYRPFVARSRALLIILEPCPLQGSLFQLAFRTFAASSGKT